MKILFCAEFRTILLEIFVRSYYDKSNRYV